MGKIILVVDDDRNIGQILHASFTAKGYEVVVSRNGEDALQKYEEIHPSLILLDVLLPKMNGWEVCKRIKDTDQGKKTPVILMSAIYKNYKMQADAKNKYGADEFVEKPFQLARLLAKVMEMVGPADEEMPEEPTEPEEEQIEEPSVALTGDLTSVTFPELLHNLYVMQQSGTLVMTNDDKRKEISVSQGYPVSVQSNIEAEYFGQFLLRMRKIKKSHLEESLQRMQETKRLQGTILIEMGVLSPQDVVNYLKLQMRQKIFEIFSWRKGQYEFVADKTVTGDISAIDMSVANIIFYGVKKHFDLDYCLEKLENYGEKYVRFGTDHHYRFQDLELTPSESKFLMNIDGGKTVDDLLDASSLDPLASYQLMLTLIYSSMVELTSEQTEEGESFFSDIIDQEQAEPATAINDAPSLVDPTADPLFTDNDSGDVAELVSPNEFDEMPFPDQPADEPETKASAKPADDKAATQRRMIQEKFEQVQEANYFEIIGVGKNPTEHEVRIAYHKLAKEFHPDRFFGNLTAETKQKVEEIFGKITEAYDHLNTQEKINTYMKIMEGQMSPEEAKESRLEGVKKVLMAEQYYDNGLSFLKERRYTRAADSLRKAMEIAGNEPEYIAHYGWALYNMSREKDLDEEEQEMRGKATAADLQFQGREYLNRAISVAPRTEKAYLFLGYIYKEQGLREFAEKQFEKAMLCNPNSVDAMRELRLIKLAEQKKAKKKSLLERLLKK